MLEQESEMMEAMRAARKFIAGDDVADVRVHYPHQAPDLKVLRATLAMSQEQFAKTYSIPLSTLRGWEIGRHSPDATATAYLHVIAQIPDPVKNALNTSSRS